MLKTSNLVRLSSKLAKSCHISNLNQSYNVPCVQLSRNFTLLNLSRNSEFQGCINCNLNNKCTLKSGYAPQLGCAPNLGCAFNISRNYAKGKDKKKDKTKTKVQVNENELAQLVNIDALKTQMQKAVDVMKDEFSKQLSLRSSTGSIESLVVNIDGENHALQELAQIVRKNPKLVVINMAAFPQAIPPALQAIAKSGMNLNPQQEGTTLYVPVPKVTKEHREGLAKNAKQLFIKCKEGIRDVQTKQTKSLRKKEGVSEDLARSVEQQLVALGDNFINEAQKVLDTKQAELVGKE